jgi:NADH dehydrogenase FAD-containing subunit
MAEQRHARGGTLTLGGSVYTEAGSYAIGYDRLVLALGSIARVLPIPGLAEHGLGFNDLADAIALRSHVLRRLEAADERGRVRIDEYLRVEGRDDVWALGDCADVPNTRTPGQTDPPASQHGLRQARRLARNLTGSPQPYGYRMLGQVATPGRYKGIADVMGVRFRGFMGWFVARTYHLFQLPLWSRKLRVVADWTTSLFFRRDIAELSILAHPRRLE